jgi:tetratricopeptide (TPR) repeat protein
MLNNDKIQEFLLKLTPCIERGDLDACLEEAARLAQEMGVGAKELLNLSAEEGENKKYGFAYVIALAAAQSFEGKEKARAYSNAGFAAQHLKKVEKAEKYYKKAIDADTKLMGAHNNYANLLRENAQYYEAETEINIALQIEPKNPYALGTYGDILADEDYLEEALKKYHEAIKNSDSMNNSEKAENHNNLGWVYANLEQYDRAKKKFEEAHKLDPQNVKVIRNIRALGKVKSEPKISKMQWRIAIVLFAGVIATWYLFLTKKLTENIFSAQTIILIAMIIFILFFHQLGKFKAGPIEFEKSTEHRNQLSEAKAKIKR